MRRRISWVAVALAAFGHSCSGGDLPGNDGANSLGADTETGGPASTAGTAADDGDEGGGPTAGATADGPCAPGQWDDSEWDAACWD